MKFGVQKEIRTKKPQSLLLFKQLISVVKKYRNSQEKNTWIFRKLVVSDGQTKTSKEDMIFRKQYVTADSFLIPLPLFYLHTRSWFLKIISFPVMF